MIVVTGALLKSLGERLQHKPEAHTPQMLIMSSGGNSARTRIRRF
jgi:hypothetical protein